MLFNSKEFIFLFLPITLFVFFLLAKFKQKYICIAWLVATSLFFYGWWNPAYLSLIFVSILFNYTFGILLGNDQNSRFADKPSMRKGLLVIGVAFNLGALGYFKYANFFVDNVAQLTGYGLAIDTIILPLAISFFTFQQIAYLVDSYRNLTKEYNFLHYCLFVTFFPQLIAGPIVHHKEMLPQFEKDETYSFSARNLSIGMTIFFIGLFKKLVLADSIAVYVPSLFSAADQGMTVTTVDAWMGSLSYTLQLYFDFSGYSDMAIGLARMFGIKLPLNFDSPYKSVNISEFWRRWHITLSRFLRDYLYIPLGGNRKGTARRYINLAATMVLGGLWHGAGWTFVIWGSLHGFYLVVHQVWQKIVESLGGDNQNSTIIGRSLSWFITFIAVVIAWVFFRAESLEGAMTILNAMSGLSGSAGPQQAIEAKQVAMIAVLLLIAWFGPSTQEIMSRYKPAFEVYKKKITSPQRTWYEWHPSALWAFTTFLIACSALSVISKESEFLYFQF